MRFPFPSWSQVVPLKVYKTELNEDGGRDETVLFDGKAFYDEKSKRVVDKTGSVVLLSGKVIIEGDIAPGQIIDGLVKVDGVDKVIYSTLRPRNPDGTVYSTELDLM